MEDGMEIPLKTRNKTTIWPSNPNPILIHFETKIERDTCIPMFIAALFTIDRPWNQPRCPLTDEWIKKLWYLYTMEYSVQFSSVAQLCLTLCDPMDCSTSSLPVHHQLPEFTQTHVHWVADAIQPSHPLSSPSPPAFNHSQHQGLFKWVSSSYQVAKVLEFQLQHQSFQWTLMVKLDLLAVQRTLKSLLQHHSPKASILWGSAFFIVQLSNP